MRDYYKVLGVDRNISQKDLKKHFYKLARKYHPDTTDDENKIEYEKKLKNITEAYNALSTIDKRRRYQMTGRGRTVFHSSGFSTMPSKARKELILIKLDYRVNFSIHSFANELRVHYLNLTKIISKLIDVMDINAKIENGYVVFDQ